jgi:hypothetical protein
VQEKEDTEGFAMLLSKQMNTTALKKTKSDQPSVPVLDDKRTHMTFGLKNIKF